MKWEHRCKSLVMLVPGNVIVDTCYWLMMEIKTLRGGQKTDRQAWSQEIICLWWLHQVSSHCL